MLFIPACTVELKKKRVRALPVSSCRLSPAMQRCSCGRAKARVAARFSSQALYSGDEASCCGKGLDGSCR